MPSIAVAFALVSLALVAAGQGRAAREERADFPVVLAGSVLAPDGAPAQGAVVVTSAGGRTVTTADGRFELALELPPGVGRVELSATLADAADANGLCASASVVPAALSARTSVGALVLAPSPSCLPRWLPTFGGLPGVDGPVEGRVAVDAFAVFDDGGGTALYVGGEFTRAGGASASFLARWDGSRWCALAGGDPNGPVEALAVFDDGGGPALYAGGSFTEVGGVAASGIARWDGASWSALGGGLDGTAGALLAFDDGGGPALYVGGVFTGAGGTSANSIARWDGTSWSTLGTGFSAAGGSVARVAALAAFDDGGGPALYAGGRFNRADGLTALHVARWDGTSWSALNVGTTGNVLALAVFDDGTGPALYAGGEIHDAGGVAVNRIAKWDGAGWSALGTGLSGVSSSVVNALAVFDDGSGPALHAGGKFTLAGGTAANHVARWDGASWAALGSGVGAPQPAVLALGVCDAGHGAELFAGGTFLTAGGTVASRVARWDGAGWRSAGRGQGLASVDGNHGTQTTVGALAAGDDGSGPALYAGGEFVTAGAAEANHVARFDGERWTALGGGMNGGVMNGPVESVAMLDLGGGPALYAGGGFTSAGGTSANRIARWDGASWSALGGGMTSGSVHELAVFDDGGGAALYAGGSFTSAGGVTVNRVARWNGASWSALGSGANSWVEALAVFDDGGGPALYAGGSFTTAGGVTVNYVARWDGASWSALGSGLAGTTGVIGVVDLAVFDDGTGSALYACGNFETAGGQAANSIARWDGASWSTLGSEVNHYGVYALAVFDDGSGPALHAGGRIPALGGVTVNRIAKWDGASWSPLGAGLSDDPSAFVRTLAVFDDGGGAALYAGGTFHDSPAGDRHVAKWGCRRVRAAGF